MRISVYYEPFMDRIVTKEPVSNAYRFKSFCYNGSFVWFNYKDKMPENYEFIGYL